MTAPFAMQIMELSAHPGSATSKMSPSSPQSVHTPIGVSMAPATSIPPSLALTSRFDDGISDFATRVILPACVPSAMLLLNDRRFGEG